VLRSRPVAFACFAGVTLFVWTTRIRNLYAPDNDVVGAAKAATLAMSVVMLVLGVAVAVLAVRPTSTVVQQRVVGVAAALTTVVWLVRGTSIALGDRGAAFVAVHLVLAVGSVAVAGWAWWAVRSVEDCTPTATTTA